MNHWANLLIKVGKDIELRGVLYETETAKKIYQSLPLQDMGSTWGEEIYFSTSVKAALEENAREVLEAGELAYWPDMQAFCIFYGPTPASQGDEIRAAGAVNIIGRIEDDVSVLKNVSGQVEVTVDENL